jgi:hypothetical protein
LAARATLANAGGGGAGANGLDALVTYDDVDEYGRVRVSMSAWISLPSLHPMPLTAADPIDIVDTECIGIKGGAAATDCDVSSSSDPYLSADGSVLYQEWTVSLGPRATGARVSFAVVSDAARSSVLVADLRVSRKPHSVRLGGGGGVAAIGEMAREDEALAANGGINPAATGGDARGAGAFTAASTTTTMIVAASSLSPDMHRVGGGEDERICVIAPSYVDIRTVSVGLRCSSMAAGAARCSSRSLAIVSGAACTRDARVATSSVGCAVAAFKAESELSTACFSLPKSSVSRAVSTRDRCRVVIPISVEWVVRGTEDVAPSLDLHEYVECPAQRVGGTAAEEVAGRDVVIFGAPARRRVGWTVAFALLGTAVVLGVLLGIVRIMFVSVGRKRYSTAALSSSHASGLGNSRR